MNSTRRCEEVVQLWARFNQAVPSLAGPSAMEAQNWRRWAEEPKAGNYLAVDDDRPDLRTAHDILIYVNPFGATP